MLHWLLSISIEKNFFDSPRFECPNFVNDPGISQFDSILVGKIFLQQLNEANTHSFFSDVMMCNGYSMLMINGKKEKKNHSSPLRGVRIHSIESRIYSIQTGSIN